MKKYFALILMLALVVTGCKKPDPSPEPVKEDSITVSPAEYTAVYDGDSFNVTVNASGEYQAEANASWLTVSGTTVTVAENTDYEARSGVVTFTCGTVSAKVTVNQEAAPKPKEYTELPGPANSFIVSKGGDYKFKATVIGNGEAGLHETFPIKSAAIDPAGAKLVWQEFEDIITDVQLKDGYICFTCANKDGNAVIAATASDGTILWSWHIWSAEAPNDVKCTDTWTLMDRNLGAFATGVGEDALGLYYQWGRKDPFSRILKFDSGAGEGWYHPIVGNEADMDNPDIHCIEYSVAHPNEYIGATNTNKNWLVVGGQKYLWGLSGHGAPDPFFKTIFDPCPKGYAVAHCDCLGEGWGNGGVENADHSLSLYNGSITVPGCSFIYNSGWDWWDGYDGAYPCLWTAAAASWGDPNTAFRLVPGDAHSYYDTACGQPVRCMKYAE